MHCLRALLLLTLAAIFFPWPLSVVVQTARADAPDSIRGRTNLLGDMGGVRSLLAKRGIDLGLSETGEVVGNVTGGVRRGAEYDGITTMTLTLDTGKAFGWPGGTFFVSGLQIHGRNFSKDNLGSLQTSSNIEADRATRLWELWFQQTFWNGSGSVRMGLQDVSEEFLGSRCCALFPNSAMGWPALPSNDLYAGGPVYPLASSGVRLALEGGSLSFRGGVFDDNPPGGPFNDDSQLRDEEASGTRFNFTTGAFFIDELAYSVDLLRDGAGGRKSRLPGEYKIGGWYDTARFADQRFDTRGLSLAGPSSNGIARMLRSNFSIYGIADQTVWHQSGGPRSVSLFTHIMGAPSDRNLVDWSLTAGADAFAPLPGRDNDTFAIGYGFAHVSESAAELDRDRGFFTGAAYPVRGFEHYFEATYKYRAAPWLDIQPDLQYILDPGGSIPDPLHPARKVGNELIIGVRTMVKF
ncbi:MAG: carbohydrate porin [Syntrophobacteraceae bacterium]|nr:carbohydrate porin [Syntrophobacteraceae bacterium]